MHWGQILTRLHLSGRYPLWWPWSAVRAFASRNRHSRSAVSSPKRPEWSEDLRVQVTAWRVLQWQPGVPNCRRNLFPLITKFGEMQSSFAPQSRNPWFIYHNSKVYLLMLKLFSQWGVGTKGVSTVTNHQNTQNTTRTFCGVEVLL